MFVFCAFRLPISNLISFDGDQETLVHAAGFALHLADVITAAREDDADLMTEIQSFLIEPALHIPLLGNDKMSIIAIRVLGWLQVRSTFSPTNPFKMVPNDCLPVCRGLMTYQRRWYPFGKHMFLKKISGAILQAI